MWIAKNSITGKTYGKSFESIFDCQKYLKEHYKDSTSFVAEIFGRMQYALDKLVSIKDFEGVHGQNIIRCWYVEQKRFADSFDF